MGKGTKRIKRLEERLDTIKKSVVRIVEGLSKMIVNEISDIRDELADIREWVDRRVDKRGEIILKHVSENYKEWVEFKERFTPEINKVQQVTLQTAERMDRLEKNMGEVRHKLEKVAFWRDDHKEEIKEWLERIEDRLDKVECESIPPIGNPNECSKHKKGKLLPRDEYTRSLANIIGFYRERDKGIVERLGKAAMLLPEHQSKPNLLGLMADIHNQLKKDLNG